MGLESDHPPFTTAKAVRETEGGLEAIKQKAPQHLRGFNISWGGYLCEAKSYELFQYLILLFTN